MPPDSDKPQARPVFIKSLQEIADYLGCSRMQLHRWRKVVPFPKEFQVQQEVRAYGRIAYKANETEIKEWFRNIPRKVKLWTKHLPG